MTKTVAAVMEGGKPSRRHNPENTHVISPIYIDHTMAFQAAWRFASA